MRELDKENISALMDAETTNSEIVVADYGCWERYNLIGDIIRNNAPEILANEVLGKVRARLDAEPLILAPNNISKPKTYKRLGLAAGIVGALAIAVPVLWLDSDKSNNFGVAKLSEAPAAKVVGDTHVAIENGKKIERLNDPRLNRYLTAHDAAELHRKTGGAPHVKVVSYPE